MAQHTFLPCENFFGAPYDHGFLNAPKTKSLLLECTCGITDCWFLLADIHVGDDVVTWSNFEQFHREWSYDGLGSFTFDRDSYDNLFRQAKML